MFKRIVPYLIAIIIITPLIAGYLLIRKNSYGDQNLTINAVPIDAGLIIENDNLIGFLNTVNQENIFINEIPKNNELTNLTSGIRFVDSIHRNNQKFYDILFDRPVSISAHMTGRDKFEFLYIVSISNRSDKKNVISIISDLVPGQTAIKIREYNKTKIYDISFQQNRITRYLSYSFCKGLLILSESSLLVENSIRQLYSEQSLSNQTEFNEIEKTAGSNVDANIYINYKTFPRVLATLFEKSHKTKVRSFENFANWSGLDLNIKKDLIMLNGFSFSEDSSNNYIDIFKNQNPGKLTITSIIPAEASCFFSIFLSNPQKFKIDYKDYLSHAALLISYNKNLETISNTYAFDLEKSFYSFIDDELAVLYSGNDKKGAGYDKYILLKTINWSRAWEELQNLLKSYADRNNISIDDLVDNFDIDAKTRYKIYKMPVKKIIEKLFGQMFSDVITDYYAFIDNYLVFGRSKSSLEKIITSFESKKTLNNDSDFNDFTDNMSSKSNFYFYSNISGSIPLFSRFLNEKISRILNTNISFFNSYKALGVQFSSSRNMFYNNICIKSGGIVSAKPATKWEIPLEDYITIKPKLTKNHITGTTDIFVQDKSNNIYLIDNKGNIIWKHSLDEGIISDIYQIDYYKNGKLQFLFNTKNKIHLFDINGNYVDKYPLNLSSQASNGMALFDYDNNKNYRIFIANENKKISVFNKEGEIIKGWKFNQSESEVNFPVQHIRINNKDYIVFSDHMNIYILDRRGKVRLNIQESFPLSLNNPVFFYKGNSSRSGCLICTDNKGVIRFIDFNGKIEKLELSTFTPEHYFEFSDIDKDSNLEYIFLDGRKLEVYNKEARIFSYNFKKKINTRPGIYRFKGNKIGISSDSENKIYLFNSNGSLYNGFPLNGHSQFSIGNIYNNNNLLNLFVGGNNEMLYNYNVINKQF